RSGASFGKLMPTDVGERLQALRLARHGALGVTPGVAVQFPEEAELHFHPAAGAPTVVRAVIPFTRVVDVDRVITIGLRTGDSPADFTENLRRAGCFRGDVGATEEPTDRQ